MIVSTPCLNRILLCTLYFVPHEAATKTCKTRMCLASLDFSCLMIYKSVRHERVGKVRIAMRALRLTPLAAVPYRIPLASH